VKTYITVYFGAVLLAMLLVPIVSRLAKRCRLVDVPGPRKVHKIPIPRIGGIVFWVSTLALVLPVFFLNNKIGQSFRESRTEFIVLLTAASFIFAVGLFDDLRSIRGYIKLLCLIAASLAICASGAAIRAISVGSWFVLELGWAGWPLSVVWIITITVGINFIDGLDGLAAGIAAIVCGSILLLALWYGQAAMAVLMLALLGSVTGFLFFNFYPAKIFMGDCGSMFLGFLIGASSLVCQTKTAAFVGLAIPLLVMGVPILDTGIVIIGRRIIRRYSVFTSDRNHLHHRLLDLGLRHRTVVIVIYAVTAICAVLGSLC
jgi:UDP-GlcNAc:undecaprenyl-phosphate GlcNAc-1-phosphate transferase